MPRIRIGIASAERAWLETAIQTANTCLVVTHDRYFLENVATQMVEVNPVYPQSAFQVKGNYSEFLERREDVLEGPAQEQEPLEPKVGRGGEGASAAAEESDGQPAGRGEAARPRTHADPRGPPN